jgi:hypothetical protein
MTRRQLEADIHADDFDIEEDMMWAEHYSLNRDGPMFLPTTLRKRDYIELHYVGENVTRRIYYETVVQ